MATSMLSSVPSSKMTDVEVNSFTFGFICTLPVMMRFGRSSLRTVRWSRILCIERWRYNFLIKMWYRQKLWKWLHSLNHFYSAFQHPQKAMYFISKDLIFWFRTEPQYLLSLLPTGKPWANHKTVWFHFSNGRTLIMMQHHIRFASADELPLDSNIFTENKMC